MKTIIWLLIIIGWSVLQARRKAMRERERQQRAASMPEPPVPQYQPRETPRELDAIMEYARSRVQPEASVRSIESVMQQTALDEVVTREVSDIPDYSEPQANESIPQFTPTTLRTFFVMREVLGPPRAKKRFHARMKAQD